MATEHESREDYTIYENGQLGEVKISNEVIAVIAGIATMETEGVASMAGHSASLQKELISRLGMKVLSKGVKIDLEDRHVSVDISVELEYGCKLQDVTRSIQERVKSTVESMTDLSVDNVNVRVVDVKTEDE